MGGLLSRNARFNFSTLLKSKSYLYFKSFCRIKKNITISKYEKSKCYYLMNFKFSYLDIIQVTNILGNYVLQFNKLTFSVLLKPEL